MKFYLLCAFFMLMKNISAQNYNGNFTFRGELYTIKSEKQKNGSFKILIEKDNDNKNEFLIKPLKLATFDIAFKNKLTSILPADSRTISSSETTELTNTAKSSFYSIVAESLKDGASEAPVAGNLTIAKSIERYDITNNTEQGKGKVEIDDIEIEFHEGYIEIIKVNATASSTNYRFENKYGIGFSTRRNYNGMKQIRLFDQTSGHFIKLGELLNYDYKVRMETRDFSPGNQVINTYGGQKLDLHKDETSKLLEAIVYSDFIGLESEKPNGLIQTELAKRINLFPVRKQTQKLTWLSKGYGVLQFLRASVTLSKIEENNRYLNPINNDSILKGTDNKNFLKKQVNVTPLQILNHQNLSLGLDLNLLFYDNPDVKYNFYINGGFRFGRTSIRDSARILNDHDVIEKTGLVDDYGISYLLFYPEAVLHFLPEERFNIVLTERLQYFKPAFDVPLVRTYNKELKLQDKATNWINSFEISMRFKTGDKGNIFGRWRINSQLGNIKQHFHQAQLGYSFYILKRN